MAAVSPTLRYQVARVRSRPEDSHRTLCFVIRSSDRRKPSKFFRPGDVPEFDGESAWFEIDRSCGRWTFLRQVDGRFPEVSPAPPQAVPAYEAGDLARRIGGAVPGVGMEPGGLYEVATYDPGLECGLELRGLRGRWNERGFEKADRS